jgi:hypothetical protein
MSVGHAGRRAGRAHRADPFVYVVPVLSGLLGCVAPAAGTDSCLTWLRRDAVGPPFAASMRWFTTRLARDACSSAARTICVSAR